MLGIAILYWGAEWLIRGSAGIARAFGVKPLVVGLTVVAYGTSAPELAVATKTALAGHTPIALGTVIGSCAANISLDPRPHRADLAADDRRPHHPPRGARARRLRDRGADPVPQRRAVAVRGRPARRLRDRVHDRDAHRRRAARSRRRARRPADDATRSSASSSPRCAPRRGRRSAAKAGPGRRASRRS